MQGREDQMTGLGRRERQPHRFRIAHFADDDHVWRLPQRGPQRAREIGHIGTDFLLLHHALLVPVLVLDRILDRDDVAALAAVDLGNERCERRRLARSRGTADEDEATRQPCEDVDRMREAKGGETQALHWAAPGWPPRDARARDAG